MDKWLNACYAYRYFLDKKEYRQKVDWQELFFNLAHDSQGSELFAVVRQCYKKQCSDCVHKGERNCQQSVAEDLRPYLNRLGRIYPDKQKEFVQMELF